MLGVGGCGDSSEIVVGAVNYVLDGGGYVMVGVMV